jgi:hypothetical protein
LPPLDPGTKECDDLPDRLIGNSVVDASPASLCPCQSLLFQKTEMMRHQRLWEGERGNDRMNWLAFVAQGCQNTQADMVPQDAEALSGSLKPIVCSHVYIYISTYQICQSPLADGV